VDSLYFIGIRAMPRLRSFPADEIEIPSCSVWLPGTDMWPELQYGHKLMATKRNSIRWGFGRGDAVRSEWYGDDFARCIEGGAPERHNHFEVRLRRGDSKCAGPRRNDKGGGQTTA
jgi:hypothetical protein